MQLLVTTSQSVLLLDSDSGQAHRLHSGGGLYYGIAHHGDHLYVAARRRLVSSTVPPAEERGVILMFDRRLRPCGQLEAPFALRDLHEIAWHDGCLWVTASHDNMVAIRHPDGRWEPWYPLGQAGQGDVNHFNSFMFEDDRVWLLAHNRGPSELLAFSLKTRALLQRQTLGNCSHNIWREQGLLHTCSSAESRLMGENGFALETGGFPRGVAFDGRQRCVGISVLVERKERDFTSGQLLVLGRDWQAGHALALEREGLILDLLPLPDGFAPAAPGPLQRLRGVLPQALGGTPPEAAARCVFARA